MEFGASNAAGFHGYNTNTVAPAGTKAADISMGLPPKPNQAPGGNNNTECVVREQDRFMPIANVIRIMRKILPPHAKISDDAKENIQECVSEFISFVTGEANDRCQREQRKTITAEDILWAMSKLGFDDYIEPLTLYLHRYREFDGGDRGSLRGDPLVKRVVAADHAFSTLPQTTAFHHMIAPAPAPHHSGFYAPLPPMDLFKDAVAAGPSCIEPPPPPLPMNLFKDSAAAAGPSCIEPLPMNLFKDSAAAAGPSCIEPFPPRNEQI
ncbi:nuclear transcription factor Y subunit B-8-like [Andrographis paniculata]|uniref:nuclear transcription factor Y subunit B-8-like n=1 Tax=Andrographis paniculata TaxID=175694 RepID=UPI0021E7B651|nr:nuclear transcription factor Y subunit B-8-like [Andrographis paniculata]